MRMTMYSIRDRKAGIYGAPFMAQNDEVAKRDFVGFCSHPQNAYLANDMELYKMGEFESDTGEVIGEPKPLFIICGYLDQRVYEAFEGAECPTGEELKRGDYNNGSIQHSADDKCSA